MSWLLGDSNTAIQILPTELSRQPIRADAVILLTNTNQILHLEFQTLPESNPPLPLRMLDYWVRLYREYERPIEQVVIFLKETTSVAAYTDQLSVGNTQHRYQIVRLWEQEATLMLANPALLPFVTLAKTDPTIVLAQVAKQIDMIEEVDQRRNISACVEILASLRFDKNYIRRFLREELMRESPIYQEIIQEGKRDTIIRQLTHRFDNVSPEIQQQIQTLSLDKLDALSEALLDFTNIFELTVWLQSH
ncbi:DUF4351 domain-containing protein [Gloeocapsopsis dulcis]|uniref:DUF4351 domain-containing protein n=1 Tax=Gloeocapsopsis dulcis TaxID=2859516 RepID=UPI0030D8F814